MGVAAFEYQHINQKVCLYGWRPLWQNNKSNVHTLHP